MTRYRFLASITLLLAVVCGTGVARGDVLFGLGSTGEVNDGINPPLTWSLAAPGLTIYPGDIDYTSPVLGVSGSVDPYYASSATAWASADGPILRGYASASASNGLPDSGIFASDASFDLEWSDALFISGSADETVQLKVTLVLDSILDATVDSST